MVGTDVFEFVKGDVLRESQKMLSFVLVAAMMLSVLVMPVSAVEENEVVVHYYNENNWENPYIYYYSDGNTPVSWPGVAMKNDGDNWYSYTISNFASVKVIFSNNGADQYPGQNEEGLSVTGEKWYKSGNFYNQNPDMSKITVHYYNANGWSDPHIYYYTDSANPVTWPGVAMTSDGNGRYSYDIYGYDSAKVIFSDNGNNQDPAQNEPGYDVSGEKWYINGQLYDSEPDGITVHFYNYDNWSNVNIYYYNGDITGSDWTGVPMFANGDGWYTYKIYGLEEAKVLFNNGAGVQIPGVMEEGFAVSGEMWYRNGTWTKERPEEITVYFYKPDNWSSPNIYYYLNDNDTGSAWPGEAMVKLSDDETIANWYMYTITKYSSAKVMFNDGNNQIPEQNEPGLDASGIMWYKDGIWCDSETDTDGDDLPDCGELVLGTDINKTDTDGDLLPDGYEVNTLGTDPTKADSDDNNVSDADEDADEDGLSNLEEYRLGTEPRNKDSDGDNLEDGDEVNKYGTEPTNPDTDGDTLSDGDEIALGLNPLIKDTDGDGIPDCDEKIQQTMTQEISEEEKPEVTDVTVSFEGTGNINTTTTIENIYNIDMLSSGVVGLVGAPVEIESTSEFDTATITFTYDPDKLGDTKEEDLSVMWYDEEEKWYHILDQESIVDTVKHTVSVETTHFSKYMIVNRKDWFDTWNNQEMYKHSEGDGYHFSFVVDVSGSMSGHRLEKAKEALLKFADTFTEKDTKSLIAFNSKADMCSYIYNSTTEFKQAVENLKAGGGTSVNAGLSEAVSELDDRDSSKEKIIVLLCDGDVDNCSSIVEYCIWKNVKIYTINVESGDSDKLIEIAEKTGGKYYNAIDAQDIIEMLSRMNMNIDKTDSDGDGLPDTVEKQGMYTSDGEIYYSDPEDKHSDSDGLTDNEEMGIDGDFDEKVIVRREYIGYGVVTDCFYFDARSNPELPDTDLDGYDDSCDMYPLFYDEVNGLIYQSKHKMGLGYDEMTLADDLKTNDFSYSDMMDIDSDFEYQLDLSVSGLENDFRYMCNSFFARANREIINDLIDVFLNGTNNTIPVKTGLGVMNIPCYTNNSLSEQVYDDQQVQKYFDFTKEKLVELLQECKGNFAKVKRVMPLIIRSSGTSKIKFSRDNPGYLFFGLTISINDLWGSNIYVDDYHFDGKHFSGTLNFTLYDHFGLDKPDVEKLYVNLAGFRAWYVLQHYDKFNGEFTPFINLMKYTVPFEGEIR